jgi:formylmethanofuran dehydrogenase subunit C
LYLIKIKEFLHYPNRGGHYLPGQVHESVNCRNRRTASILWQPQKELSDLFSIEGNTLKILLLRGDLTHVKKIGYGMSRGSILIRAMRVNTQGP